MCDHRTSATCSRYGLLSRLDSLPLKMTPLCRRYP